MAYNYSVMYCEDCGAQIERTGGAQKRCPSCARIALREQRRRNYAARAARTHRKPAPFEDTEHYHVALNGYTGLAVAVLCVAAADARDGNHEAATWLATTGAEWLEVLRERLP